MIADHVLGMSECWTYLDPDAAQRDPRGPASPWHSGTVAQQSGRVREVEVLPVGRWLVHQSSFPPNRTMPQMARH